MFLSADPVDSRSHKLSHYLALWLGLLLPALFQACLAAHDPELEPLRVIKPDPDLDADKVALGSRLFNDKRFSANNRLSCASCHDLNSNGADHNRFTPGFDNEPLSVNTPTAFNSSRNAPLFWDGRALGTEEQIDFVVTSTHEFNTSWPTIIAKLSKDTDYLRSFRHIYDSQPNRKTILDALTEFEKSLITPGSRFDQYLLGEHDALTEQEKKGYRLFKSYGCIACHQGQNVGGNMFQKFGTFRDFFRQRKHISKADLGRYNVTGEAQDKHVFRVPSLRLVVLTPPYFHDGSAKTLTEAISVMARYQLGRKIPQQDVDSIIAFLHTLPGQYRGRSLAVDPNRPAGDFQP